MKKYLKSSELPGGAIKNLLNAMDPRRVHYSENENPQFTRGYLRNEIAVPHVIWGKTSIKQNLTEDEVFVYIIVYTSKDPDIYISDTPVKLYQHRYELYVDRTY